MKLGNLVINGGTASIVLPVQKAYFNLAIQTRNARPGTRLFTRGETVVDIRGTYADAPVTGALIGGALLSLRNGSTPYPVDLHLQNGQTRAYLTGTIKDPVNFAGAHLHLAVSGQNMADLDQLTGISIPATPPFSLSGNLDDSDHALRFKNISGRVGSSDIEGTIIEAPGSPRLVTANLTSRRVNLTDLAGFLGRDPLWIEAEPPEGRDGQCQPEPVAGHAV